MASEITITAVVCTFICCLLPAFVMQTVGMAAPYWVSNSTCDSIGLFYHCCGGEDGETCELIGDDVLDRRVVGLLGTAFAITACSWLAFFCACHSSFSSDPDVETTKCCICLGAGCALLYPVAGLFILIGCLLLVPTYSDFGYSFILSLTSGCIFLVVSVIIFIAACCAGVSSNDLPSGDTKPDTESQSAADAEKVTENIFSIMKYSNLVGVGNDE